VKMLEIISKQLKELVVLTYNITISSKDSLYVLFPTFPQGINMYSGIQFVTLVNLQSNKCHHNYQSQCFGEEKNLLSLL
jgi:hypothetical protein